MDMHIMFPGLCDRFSKGHLYQMFMGPKFDPSPPPYFHDD